MDGKQARILVVEDDLALCEALSGLLSSQPYEVAVAHTKADAEVKLAADLPDLLILDINLPDGNGLDFCRDLRSKITIPIIILTGVQEEVEKILALEFCASHYLTKPINPRVLLAYIKSSLKQEQNATDTKSTLISAVQDLLVFEKMTLNVSTQALYDAHNQEIALTPAEYRLLWVFCQHPKRVLTRDMLLDLTESEASVLDRSIDILVSRLRRRLGAPHLIKTVRAGGYLFDASVSRQEIQCE